MRTLPCPMLVVPRPVQPGGGRKFTGGSKVKPERILVGMDFSTDSNQAFQYGLDFAQEYQAELHLAHVIEPPLFSDFRQQLAELTDASQGTIRDRIIEQIDSMIPQEALNWCAPNISILAGKPHEELVKYAMLHQIDLIVLGVTGYGLVESILLGSTTDRVSPNVSLPGFDRAGRNRRQGI